MRTKLKKYSLNEIIEIYLKEKDISKDAKECYLTILKQYVTFLKTQNITYATKEDIVNYIKYKKSLNISSRWMHHQISVIKGFYLYISDNYRRLGLHQIYQDNIASTIQNVSIKNNKPKETLDLVDAKRLLSCMKSHQKDIFDFRDYALILLMLTTGLRSIEIRRAKIKDLKTINNQTVLYIQGKGHQATDAFIKITPHVNDALHIYLNKRNDQSPYLFISHKRHGNNPNVSRAFIYCLLKRQLRRCQLDHIKLYPHMLRHTAAKLNLKSGNSIEQTRQLLRHENIETTLIYTSNIHTLKKNVSNDLETYILYKHEKSK